MEAVFYTSAIFALLATVLAVITVYAVHALLYFALSLLFVALLFYVLGAPFAAALEVVIYAGAVVVLFVFVVMMLNLGAPVEARERRWERGRVWVGPALLGAALLAEITFVISRAEQVSGAAVIDAKVVGSTLYGPYLLAVELASMLLLAGLVGAYHLGRRWLEKA